MDQSLLARLRAAVDEDLPETTPSGEAAWGLHTIFGSPAPTILLSRDPRTGPRLAPVYFIATADVASRDDLAWRLYRSTEQFAKLRHTLGGPGRPPYLLVPPMFHVDAIAGFTAAMDAALDVEAAAQPLAWIVERCELVIEKDPFSWRLDVAADGSTTAVVARDRALPLAN